MKKTCIFLDPPYIASCNNFYFEDTGENIANIYEKMYHYELKNITQVQLLFVMETTGCLKYYFMIILTEKQNIQNISKYEEKYCSYLLQQFRVNYNVIIL